MPGGLALKLNLFPLVTGPWKKEGSPTAHLGNGCQLCGEVHNVQAPAVTRLHQAACLAGSNINRHGGTAGWLLPKLGALGGPQHAAFQLALWG